MRPLSITTLTTIVAILIGYVSAPVQAQTKASALTLGPFGPEGPRLREQLWMLPSGNPAIQLRATVFRPDDVDDDEKINVGTRHPLIVINHGTSDQNRLSVAMPVYYWLSRWFVERGYVVVLPQRRGHGATGGALVESVGNCLEPDHLKSGTIAADDIEAAVSYMSHQDFIAPDETIVLGISTGGWASLALAARNPPGVRAVINIAGGRGGHALGRDNAVCGEQQLIASAGAFGASARTPTLWLYAANDSYFGPLLARQMSEAWSAAGGLADLQILPAYGTDGHELVDDRAGWEFWGPWVQQFLEQNRLPEVATTKPGDEQEPQSQTAAASAVVERTSESATVPAEGGN